MRNSTPNRKRYRLINEQNRAAWWNWRQQMEETTQAQTQEEAEEAHAERRKRRIAGQFAWLRAAAAEQHKQEQQAETLRQQQDAQAWDDVFRFVLTMQQQANDRDLDR